MKPALFQFTHLILNPSEQFHAKINWFRTQKAGSHLEQKKIAVFLGNQSGYAKFYKLLALYNIDKDLECNQFKLVQEPELIWWKRVLSEFYM